MRKPDICQSEKGCNNRARFYIGSLKRELEGLFKWLWLCNSCERKVAEENGLILAGRST